MWNPLLFSFDACDSNAKNSAASPGGLWHDTYSPKKTSTTVETSNALPYHLDESYPDFLPSMENAGPPLAPQLMIAAATLTNPFDPELCKEVTAETSTTITSTAAAAYVQELSTEDVIRTAAFHFIQMSPRGEELPLLLTQPFGLLISGLTSGEVKNVELAAALLAAAEKVSHQQHARASSILAQCDRLSSNTGNPVERVVYYFSQALQERIRRETGRLPWESKHVVDVQGDFAARNVIREMLARHPVHAVAHHSLPFSQILQFASVQAMLDRMSNARRIHIVDLSIKHGHQWTVLMQVLAMRPSCRVELLKVSAVASSLDATADVASRLSGFAESLRLPFKFVTVVVADLKDLRESAFELEEGEAVGVYSGEAALSGLIATPDRLEKLMRVLQKLKPAVLTFVDVEAKHNSSSFASRFTEALFYFSALFDCLDGMMGRGDGSRTELEGIYYSQSIRSIVAAEGPEREVRHVGIDVWRRFFARFGLVEAELSDWSLYQAGMLLKQFGNGESCTLEKNGRSLLIGWKGTPMNFASAWLFQRGEGFF